MHLLQSYSSPGPPRPALSNSAKLARSRARAAPRQKDLWLSA